MLRNQSPMATTMKTCFASIVQVLVLLSFASAFSPADHYLINCGSRAAEVWGQDNRVFTGDGSRFTSSARTAQLEGDGSKLAAVSPIYWTARAFDHPVHYSFPIRDRGTHHMVRLHFYPLENDNSNLFEAEIHVVANGFFLLRNFRFRKSDGLPVIKEFVIPVDSDRLEITMMPSEKSKFGFVNAIEVISAPKDLIADVAQFIDDERNERVYGLLKSGFETVYRVNVGGPKVTPYNDSLWRTWVTDDQYLISSQGSDKIHYGGRIKYQLGGASREVGPDHVYNTARLIRSSDDSIPHMNLTWSFAVEKGYTYMVRMHFCDIASIASHLLYFNVYVNGNLAYYNLDLSDITNGLMASPFYADFVVDVDVEMNSSNLILSVGPSNTSLPHAVDALLNGIEIWKLNNSMGSFDGEVCADYAWRSWRKGHTGGIFLYLAAVMLLLLSVSVFFQWRKNGSVGWSRLPVDASEASWKSGRPLSSIKT